jgi:hypothetical protein
MRVLNAVRACLGDGEFDVFDVFDRKVQTVGDGGNSQSGNRHPFRFARNAQLDHSQGSIGMGYRLIHTSAFIAASSSS